MDTAHFCPGCGRAFEVGSAQSFCPTCGADLRTLTSADSKARDGAALAAADAETTPPASGPAQTPHASMLTSVALPHLVQPGQPLREGAEAALIPVALWAAVAAIVASLVPIVGVAAFSPIGSFLAGLGYHVASTATVGNSGLGVGINASGEGSISIAPFLSLLGLAAAAWWGQRRIARRRPAATPREAALRAAGGAGIAAASIFAVSQLSSAALGNGTALLTAASRLTGASVSDLTRLLGSITSLSFGPNLLGIVPLVVFLYAGALGGEGLLFERAERWIDPVGRRNSVVTAIGGYLAVAVALLSLGAVLSVVAMFHEKVDLMVFLAWLGLLPNAVVVAIAALFGAGIDVVAASSAGSTQDPTHFDLWTRLPAFAIPLAALPALSAGFVAGALQQRRLVPHNLVNTGITAAMVFGSSLVLAMVALPSASASGSASFGGASGQAILAATLTPQPQLLLGFLLLAAGVHVGRRFGGSSLQFVIVRGGSAGRRIGDMAQVGFALAKEYWRRRGARGLVEDTRGRLGGLSRPAQIGLGGLVVGIALAGFGLNYVNSVDFRVKGALADLAARHPSSALIGSTALDGIGVAGAPADVAFHVSDITVADLPNREGDQKRFAVDWSLTSVRNGAQVSRSAQHAIFTSVSTGNAFMVSDVSGRMGLAGLLAGVQLDSASAVATYVEAASKANEDPSVDVSIGTETTAIPSEETITHDEATWLTSEPDETTTSAADGVRTTYSYSVAGDSYASVPLFSEVTTAATPAVVSHGTLRAEALQQSAHDALVLLADARAKGDLVAATAVLSGSDGLQVSGLQASGIAVETATELTITGTPLDGYVVRMSDGRIIRPALAKVYDGAWLVDYSGQPLYRKQSAPLDVKMAVDTVSLTFVASQVAGQSILQVETSWTWSPDGPYPFPHLKLTPVVDGRSLATADDLWLTFDNKEGRDFEVEAVPRSIALTVGIDNGNLTSVPLDGSGTPAPVAGAETRVAICGAKLRTEPSGEREASRKATIGANTTVTVLDTVAGKPWSTPSCGDSTTLSGTDWYRITAVDGIGVQASYGVQYLFAAVGLFR